MNFELGNSDGAARCFFSFSFPFHFFFEQGRFVGFLHRRQFRSGRRASGNEVATTGGPGSSHVHLVTLTFDRILVAGLPVAFTRIEFVSVVRLIRFTKGCPGNVFAIFLLRRDCLVKIVFREIENVVGYIRHSYDNYKTRTMIEIKVT